MCSHPHTSIIYVPLIVDENFIYRTTFLSSFIRALKGVVHHHNKTHYNKILPLEPLKMKARQRKSREGGKTPGQEERMGSLHVSGARNGCNAARAWGAYKGLETLCRNGARQKQTML